MNAPAATSGIVVREAALDSDRAALVDALHRFLTPHLTSEQCEERFTWLYGPGPHGVPRAWVAREPGGSVIGVAAAFPRRIRLGDEEDLGWVLGDFCIHPEYRSLGPAVRLQQVFLDEARAGRLRFWYDFPSAGMVAVHRRLGVRPTHEVIRFAKPLRIDRKLEPILRSRFLASVAAAPANWILGIGTPSRNREGIEIERLEGRCGAEFTELQRRIGGGLGLSTVRSAEYLNWRFLAHPLQPYGILTARRGGELLGYAIYEGPAPGGDAHIADLVAPDGSPVLSALMGALLARFRAAHVATVSFALIASHPWIPTLRSFGFRPRERSPVVVAGHPGSACLAHVERGARWHLVQGDRDI